MNGPLRPCVSKAIRLIVLACFAGLLPTASLGQTIVWTDQYARRIQRKDVNGGEVGTIIQLQSPQTVTVIHYDPVASKLYYLYFGAGTGSFQRANLDGSEPESIPTPSWGNFTLNVESRKLYWISRDSGSHSVLNRSELDGSGLESHTYPSCCLFTLEAFGDDLFFGAGGPMLKGIWRADPDGSNEQFLHATSEPMDLAYDPVENKLYCAAVGAIYRINPDGTGFERAVSLPGSYPSQVEVDSRARKLYWADPLAKVIQRSNLDGTNVEDFVTASDVGNPNLDLQGLTIVYNSTPVPEPNGTKGRALSFFVPPATAAGPLGPTAIRITMLTLQHPDPPNVPCCPPPDFSGYELATCSAVGETNSCARWVGKPGTFLESQDLPAQGSFTAARLQCTPYYHDFTSEGLLHVVGAEILPSSAYDIQVFAASCKGGESTCTDVSTAVTMTTRRWGDIAANFNPPSTTTQPDALDVAAVVNKLKNLPGALVKAITQLQPNLPELNADVNALDIVAVVDAVKQLAYPFGGPCPCPSAVPCGPAMGSVACASPTPCVTAFGTGATCVKTCSGGDNAGDPCINNTHCPGGNCGEGFCRDRCGRCTEVGDAAVLREPEC